MKLTPIEIRQKQFTKRTLGGVDRDEVDAYLQTVSQAYEKQMEDNHQLKERLAASEREVAKLREIESSLYKTLKTAEDTGATMVEQARQQGGLHLREAELKAETILKEARWQAKSILDEARQEAHRTYDRLHADVNTLEEECRQMEHNRDSMLAELRSLASEVIEKVERHQARTRSVSFDGVLPKAQEFAISPSLEAALQDTTMQGPATAMPPQQAPLPQEAQGSFFDQI